MKKKKQHENYANTYLPTVHCTIYSHIWHIWILELLDICEKVLLRLHTYRSSEKKRKKKLSLLAYKHRPSIERVPHRFDMSLYMAPNEIPLSHCLNCCCCGCDRETVVRLHIYLTISSRYIYGNSIKNATRVFFISLSPSCAYRLFRPYDDAIVTHIYI